MSTTPKPQRKAPALRLIDAAEMLIGEHGLDGVSLLQIAKKAGQANKYAVQYHFGTKEALVRAVFEDRLERIGKRRWEMLDALRENPTVRSLLAAFIYPVYAEVGTDGLHHYARFASRVLDSPLVSEAWMRAENFASAARLKEQLATLTPYLTEPEFNLRLTLAAELLMRSLAVIDRLHHADFAGAPQAAADIVLNTAINVAAAAFAETAGTHFPAPDLPTECYPRPPL